MPATMMTWRNVYPSRASRVLSCATASRRCEIVATKSKYSHQNAAVERNARPNAAKRAASSGSSDVVAPVTTIDSPRAMMMKSWNRSAKCDVSTSHESGLSGRRPGHAVEDEGCRVVDRYRDQPERDPR